MIIDINNTNNKYDIIYTDPPWQQTKSNFRKARPNQKKAFDYETLSIEEIAKIHSNLPVNEKYNVFMWTIDKYLHETEAMMENLGYKLHVRMIWDKENGIAPAFTIRFCHEYLLWFYKPKQMLMPCDEARGKYMSVLREASTKHSKKPICVYEMIETMFPDVKNLNYLHEMNVPDGTLGEMNYRKELNMKKTIRSQATYNGKILCELLEENHYGSHLFCVRVYEANDDFKYHETQRSYPTGSKRKALITYKQFCNRYLRGKWND